MMTMGRDVERGRSRGFAVLLAIALCIPAVAAGGEPTEQIRGAIDRGLTIVKRADLQGDAKKAQRRELLRKELFPYFNFDEMAQAVPGNPLEESVSPGAAGVRQTVHGPP